MASPLTDTELVTVAEIIGELYELTQFWAQNLTDGQLTSMRADITTWSAIRDKHTVIDGNGVKINPRDKRAAITRRIRRMLRLDSNFGGANSVRIVRG